MNGRPGAALLGVAIAALVACAAPARAASMLPIPGTSLSLGMRLTRVDSLVAFRMSARSGSSSRRTGLTRFFGLDAATTLDFEFGRLTHAHFDVQDVSTHSRDYAYDQLGRSGFKPSCERHDDTHHECDWNGACLLHVAWQPGTLAADVRAPEGWTAADTGAAAAAAPAAAANRPVAPIPALAPSAPVVTTSGTGPAAAAAAGAAAAGGAAAGATALATLPDTLYIGWPNDVASRHRARTQVPPGDPVYPEAARRAGVQGVVRLLATVDARGMVARTEIVHGIPELDQAAIAAARSCRFVPLGPPGMPQGFVVVVQVRFVR
jgi:TonB family protein